MQKFKILLFIIFLTTSLFGMILSFHKGSHFMAPCFLARMETLCDMDALSHIKMWDSVFTSNIEPITWKVFLLAPIIIFISINALLIIEKISKSIFSLRYYDPPCRTYLQTLFTKGILHPKIFSGIK